MPQKLISQEILEHKWFKNVSKGPAFFGQRQLWTIEYGLNDKIRIKKKEVILILCSFTSSNMNFQMILMPKEILAKNLSQKIGSHGTILILIMLKRPIVEWIVDQFHSQKAFIWIVLKVLQYYRRV